MGSGIRVGPGSTARFICRLAGSDFTWFAMWNGESCALVVPGGFRFFPKSTEPSDAFEDDGRGAGASVGFFRKNMRIT